MECSRLKIGKIYDLDGKSVTCKSIKQFPEHQRWMAKFEHNFRLPTDPYTVQWKTVEFVLTDKSPELARLAETTYFVGGTSKRFIFENTEAIAMRSEDWDMQHPNEQTEAKEVQSHPHMARSPQWNAARVNDRFLATGTSFAPKDKTTAAQVLFREGFTFEQVAEMFGYVKEGDRNE